VTGTYVGQVERDPGGGLWAILYCGATLIGRERVTSLRKGRRRVADLVLSAADASPSAPLSPMAAAERRLVEQNSPAGGAPAMGPASGSRRCPRRAARPVRFPADRCARGGQSSLADARLMT